MSLTARQIEIRRTGLTAGDMRVIVREDPHGRTEHDLFCSKVLGIDDFKDTEQTQLGHEIEPITLRRGSEKVGLHIMRRDPESLTVRHRQRSAHIATPDAFLCETAFHEPIALAEAKLVGLHNAWDWGQEDDQIPDWCLVQVHWQSYVTGIPIVYVYALIGTEVRVYKIQCSAELIGVLVDEADKFLRDYITPKRPPAVDGSKGARRMLRALYAKPTGPIVRATPEVEQLAREFFAQKGAVTRDEQRLEELRQHLITACGEHAGIVGEGWRLKYELRKGYDVTPKPYTVPEQRIFDCREVKSGLAGAFGRKRGGKEAA